MAGKSLPHSQHRCSCIIPVLRASFPFPQMSGLFFSSCHPKGYAGCISVTHSPVDSRAKCQRLPPILTSPRAAPRLDSLTDFFFYFHTSSSSFSLIGDLKWLWRVCVTVLSPHHLAVTAVYSSQRSPVNQMVWAGTAMNSFFCWWSWSFCGQSTFLSSATVTIMSH